MDLHLNNVSEFQEDIELFGNKFIKSLHQFAFYNELKSMLKERDLSLEALLEEGRLEVILKTLLTEDGLNLANIPKGLVPFHNSQEGSRTPFAEHLVEAAEYCLDHKLRARVHFTVPPLFQEDVGRHVELEMDRLSGDQVRFEVSYSVQNETSQTLAVDLRNAPFRTDQDLLVFRPSGHGALIENLNELDGDIIFIKNIDNVVPDSLKATTFLYKKLLAGMLIETQEKIFAALLQLEESAGDEKSLVQAENVVQRVLGITLPVRYESEDLTSKRDFIHNRLNRPLRVCGMVKNQGEPGGGPFWLEESSNMAPQIVESAQVDMDNPEQKKIFANSSHFNPVDLVCGVRDYHGKSFKLLHFVDYDSGLITVKSKDGKELKALELPGLWNGSMAHWNTLFVEVPLITFNPVKTVNDLLREEHQC
jgi:hypothetical protein